MLERMLERVSANVKNIMAIVGFCGLIASVAFAGYQYKEVHLPEFKELQHVVQYQQCIQQCIDTCRANGVPMDRCNCSHCNVYRRNAIAVANE